MALHSYDWCAFPPQLDWNWDWDLQLHALGVGGAEDAELQEATFHASRVESPVSSEASSGYLQDPVAHWNVDFWNKRQRTAATPPPRCPAVVSEDLQFLLESFWDHTAVGRDLSHDWNTTIIPEMSCSFVSEDGADASGGEKQRRPSTQVSAGQGGEEAAAVPPTRRSTVRAAAPLQKATAGAPHATARRDDRSRPVVDCGEPSHAAAASTTTPGSSCLSAPAAGKEKTGAGVLYPFAVVKPLGLDDGCMTTLRDVNRRILKRPARPVRHPVGAFACGPVTAHGLGLSGKAVVSLTKIRTGGKGTITIIRTRG